MKGTILLLEDTTQLLIQWEIYTLQEIQQLEMTTALINKKKSLDLSSK